MKKKMSNTQLIATLRTRLRAANRRIRSLELLIDRRSQDYDVQYEVALRGDSAAFLLAVDSDTRAHGILTAMRTEFKTKLLDLNEYPEGPVEL